MSDQSREQKFIDALEYCRQKQGDVIRDLKALKHSGQVTEQSYDAVQKAIEDLFQLQKQTFQTLVKLELEKR